jgi:hypothetical protein
MKRESARKVSLTERTGKLSIGCIFAEHSHVQKNGPRVDRFFREPHDGDRETESRRDLLHRVLPGIVSVTVFDLSQETGTNAALLGKHLTGPVALHPVVLHQVTLHRVQGIILPIEMSQEVLSCGA